MTPNMPDQIWLGRKEYSWRTDWTVNGWLMVAALLSGASDIMFPHIVRQWPVTVQTIIAVLPFVAIGLWARSLTLWIHGMDELHRKITVSAVLVALSATFFLVLLWHRLDKTGFFHYIFSTTRNPDATWDIGTVGHVFFLLTIFYMIAYSIFNRRYQ